MPSVSAASSGSRPVFIPASTWEGSKPCYFFGTTKAHGTGYHLDGNNDPTTTISPILSSALRKKTPTGVARNRPQLSDVERPSAKRAKRSVVIAEDQNQVRTIPDNAALLLQQAEESASGAKVLDLTPKGVKVAIQALQKAYEKNQLMRAQHPDKPELYMDSEVALYEAIAALQPLAADPPTLYPTLAKNDGDIMLWTDILHPLCLHDNTDVVSSLVALLLEWMDPSLWDAEHPPAHPNNRSLVQLGHAILESLLDVLVANLARLQRPATVDDQGDSNNTIGKGVDDVLSLLENLMELDMLLLQSNSEEDQEPLRLSSSKTEGSSVAAQIVQDTPLLSWLFTQINDNTTSKNRSLELLAFLLQREDVHGIHPDWTNLPAYASVFDNEGGAGNEDKNANSKKPKEATAIDAMEIILLHGIAPFRKRQPADDTELEALENACIVVEAALTFSPANTQAFLNAQGIELVLRCLKEKVHAGGVALKLLDFSGKNVVYRKACEHLVAEAGGLKYLFPLYMGRQIPKPALEPGMPGSNGNKNKKGNHAIIKAKREWLHTIETQTIRILYSLTRHLTTDSPADAKQRLLAKFLDEDKSDRLVELLLAYDQKARMAEFKFWKSEVEDELQDDEALQLAALEAKLRGGGDIFHRLGALAGFCCAGSKRCHEHILAHLALQKSGISVIKSALEEFISVLGPGQQADQLQSYFNEI